MKDLNYFIKLIDESKKIYTDLPEIKNLVSIAETKKLTKEEEEKLFTQFKNGDNEALDKLLDSWEWVIINTTQRHFHKGVSIKKLMNAGRKGLKRSIEVSFEIELVYRFGAWWINQSMLKLVLNKKNNT